MTSVKIFRIFTLFELCKGDYLGLDIMGICLNWWEKWVYVNESLKMKAFCCFLHFETLVLVLYFSERLLLFYKVRTILVQVLKYNFTCGTRFLKLKWPKQTQWINQDRVKLIQHKNMKPNQTPSSFLLLHLAPIRYKSSAKTFVKSHVKIKNSYSIDTFSIQSSSPFTSSWLKTLFLHSNKICDLHSENSWMREKNSCHTRTKCPNGRSPHDGDGMEK